jgi:hypothetical protein
MNMPRFMKLTIYALAVAFAGLSAGLSSAQDVLPWKLSDFPSGGPAFTEAVAEPLTDEPDLLIPTCRALQPGTVDQTTSGFAGIAKAVDIARTDIALEILDQLPECCPYLTGVSTDAKISFGAGLAQTARRIGEVNINSAHTINRLVGICGDDTVWRSYEVALGDDSLAQQIAKAGPYGPDVTGSINPPVTGGGGLPTTN